MEGASCYNCKQANFLCGNENKLTLQLETIYPFHDKGHSARDGLNLNCCYIVVAEDQLFIPWTLVRFLV